MLVIIKLILQGLTLLSNYSNYEIYLLQSLALEIDILKLTLFNNVQNYTITKYKSLVFTLKFWEKIDY